MALVISRRVEKFLEGLQTVTGWNLLPFSVTHPSLDDVRTGVHQ